MTVEIAQTSSDEDERSDRQGVGLIQRSAGFSL